MFSWIRKDNNRRNGMERLTKGRKKKTEDEANELTPLSYEYDKEIPGRSWKKRGKAIPPKDMARICLYGTVAGDIFGSTREGVAPKKGVDYRTADMLKYGYFTDDTVLSVAVFKALARIRDSLSKMPDEDILSVFSEEYKKAVRKYPNLPYSERFLDWAYSDLEMAPYESYGDGVTMRATVIGAFLYDRPQEEVWRIAKLSAMPSHSHPDAIKAATVTAMMAYLAANGVSKAKVVWYGADFYRWNRINQDRPRTGKLYVSVDCIKKELLSGSYETNDRACDTAMPLAIKAISENETFEDCLRSILGYEGNTATIMAIAGGIYSILEHRKGVTSKLQGRTLDEIWKTYVKFHSS